MTFKPGFEISPVLKSVQRLIIVAAPSCCGKTVFLEHLSRGAIPHVSAKLGIGNVPDWYVCDAIQLPDIRQEQIDRLIVAYAIPSDEIVTGSLIEHGDDPRLSIVSRSRETTFITLLASAVTMTSRLKKRLRRNVRSMLSSPRHFARARKRMRGLLPIYQDADKLATVYDWWFTYTASVPSSGNWVVNAEVAPILSSALKRPPFVSGVALGMPKQDGRYVLRDGTAWRQVMDEMNRAAARS